MPDELDRALLGLRAPPGVPQDPRAQFLPAELPPPSVPLDWGASASSLKGLRNPNLAVGARLPGGVRVGLENTLQGLLQKKDYRAIIELLQRF
jgi:hypothetical protein